MTHRTTVPMTRRRITPCLFLLPLLTHLLFTEEWRMNVKATGIGILDPVSLSNTTIGHSLTSMIMTSTGLMYGTSSLRYDPFANICRVQTQLTPSQPGVIYALQISPHHSQNVSTEIHIIQVRGWSNNRSVSATPDLTIINSIPITIASPNPLNNFIYYFNSSQLLEVEPNDLLGYCFGARPFFLLDSRAPATDSYTWTPTSLSIGTVTSHSNITYYSQSALNLLFFQWNLSRSDLNMTLFDHFYSTHLPPVIPPIIGDPFYLPTALLGDIIPTYASLQRSTTPNICIVPNVPVTEPTLVYAFKGSSLYYDPYGPFILKLVHLRILNPSTIPEVSTTTVVKLIQSIDVTIASTYGNYVPFYYQLPDDQFFSMQPGDYIGYCIKDTIDQWYFNYGNTNGGHTVFSFNLDFLSQEVSLSNGVYDFNALGWANVTTRDQLNSDELAVFLDRDHQINSFTRATYISGAGPFTDTTAPILTPAKTLLDPATLPETTIGSLVSTSLYDQNEDWCTVIKPTIGSGVVYGLRSSLVPPLAQDTTITIVYGYEKIIYEPVFSITKDVSIVIPASTIPTKFEFFFTYEQLFSAGPYQTSYDSVIGWCTPSNQAGVFPYVEDSTAPTVHQWRDGTSYQGYVSATYVDQRRYDFELLQWADVTLNDLNETATRQFLTQKAMESNVLRPNTYKIPTAPSLIDPTANSDFDYLYGYQYTSYDGSWITPSMDSQLSSPTCVLFDYWTLSSLHPSVLYSVSASQIAGADHTVKLSLIVARDGSYDQDQSLFAITRVLTITIPPSTTPTKLTYFFPLDQLIQVSSGDYLGYCDHGEDIVSYTKYSSDYVYEWASDDVYAGSSSSSYNTSLRQADLLFHGWEGLTIEQLNRTAIDQFLTIARQMAGDARAGQATTMTSTGSDEPSSSGSLSSNERTVLIVCMVLFGVSLIVCVIIARSMRRRSPAPISHPPNQHLPSAAVNGRIQPKPAVVAAAPSPSPAPIRNPYQSKPIIYRGNQDGIRINLPPPSAPPNPYVYPSSTLSPPSVSRSAAVSSSSSIELLPLTRPPVSLSSIENDIPNQQPPQYDPVAVHEVEGQASVNIYLEQSPPQRLVPDVGQLHESFSSIQPDVLIYPPTNLSQISSPSSPLVYSAPMSQPSIYSSKEVSASSSMVMRPTLIPGGVTPTLPSSGDDDDQRFCEQCGRPKISKMAIFCSGCGTKY